MKLSLILACVLGFVCISACFGQTSHYLDCTSSSYPGDSLTPQTPWRTLARANSFTFQPGDSLLLKRGTHCAGMLWPKGSGTEQASIHLGSYGQGALPVIAGGDEDAGLKLYNQQYWEIENLDITGGLNFGIHIGGNLSDLRHFRITNVLVHDVPGVPLSKDTGLVVVAPDEKAGTRFHDVVIDGVTAWKTSQWAGIIVNGAAFDTGNDTLRGDHVTVRNSIVHDVAGDGILIARVKDGLIEHNVTWDTGMQESETIGTPNAIWEWMCTDCVIRYNEGFFSDSPGVDGGVFDIDYGNRNNTVENNFGHDSQGYCVAVFGAENVGGNSVNSVVRKNTCIHNGRSPRLAQRQGAIFLYTWHGGKLNGVKIENNFVLWDPSLSAPAVHAVSEFTGDLPRRFTGNTIFASSGFFLSASPGLDLSGNHFCRSHTLSQSFNLNGQTFMHPISKSSAESPSIVPGSDDTCTCPAGQSAAAVRISASQSNRWILLSFLAPEGVPQSAESRSDLVLLESMIHQFGPLGVEGLIVSAGSISPELLENWTHDWNISATIHVADNASLRKTYGLETAPELLLISPSGEVVGRWRYPVSSAEVWIQLQNHIGAPPGMQPLPACR
jgi:hypothetical protein